MKYGFVILHYKAYDVTKRCVDSILALNGSEDAFIAVVDNHSENGSAEKLMETYADFPRVKILLREANDGFSKGNNCGYEYIKNNFAPSHIIIANNDVIFDDAGFLSKLDGIYSEEHFDVLGPDIINPNTKEHQSPIRKDGYSLEEIREELAANRKKLKQLSLVAAAKNIKNALLPKKADELLKKKIHSSQRGLDHSVRYEGVCLFGACHIFSESYMARYEKAYYPEPKFYYEEDILALRCRTDGLKTVYRPDISVCHNEHSSTSAINKDEKARLRFKLENLIAAGELYEKLLEEKK